MILDPTVFQFVL